MILHRHLKKELTISKKSMLFFILSACSIVVIQNYSVFLSNFFHTFRWKNSNCSFRKDPRTKLMVIPTLVRWNNPQKLVGDQCEKLDLVEMLLTDEWIPIWNLKSHRFNNFKEYNVVCVILYKYRTVYIFIENKVLKGIL